MDNSVPPETTEPTQQTSAPAIEPPSGGPTINPWVFVPLLYFMQAIPVTIVQEVSTIFFKDLAIANESIVQWTSLISLPWSLQFLLGPLVDLNGTKRRWIVGAQAIIGIGLALTAFALNVPNAFEVSLVILGATAVVSALCNIATDGFYIIATTKEQQAKFVGVQSTCYRLGRLFCAGLLVLFVGMLMHVPGVPVSVQNGALAFRKGSEVLTTNSTELRIRDGYVTTKDGSKLEPEIKAPTGVYELEVTPAGEIFGTRVSGTEKVGQITLTGVAPGATPLLQAGPRQTAMNPRVAWTIILAAAAAIYLLGFMINRVTVPRPPADVPAVHEEPQENRRNLLRTVVLLGLGLSGYFALNAIVRLLAHWLWSVIDGSPDGKYKGWMLASKAKILGVDLGLGGVGTELAQLAICGIVVLACLILSRRLISGTPMADAFVSYVRQPGFPAIFGFIIFYRFGEAMVSKMSPLFLKDAIDKGGLAMSNEQLGLVKGFIGVIGIVLGGLIGGWVVSKYGLRKAFWPLAIAMHVPNLLYLLAASVRLNMVYVGPVNLTLGAIDFVDQFGYGFGFAGYMVYLMWVAQRGRYKTSHFAIGTGMGALCIAIAGIVSGILQANYGYQGFFIAAVFLTIPGMLTLLFIPLDDTMGKKAAA